MTLSATLKLLINSCHNVCNTCLRSQVALLMFTLKPEYVFDSYNENLNIGNQF
jgi:hypothetical protein